MWYIQPVEYYIAVKNEIPLYQMVWINHSINWKMQVPEDYDIICKSSKIIILRQRMINKKFKMVVTPGRADRGLNGKYQFHISYW